MDMRSVDTPAPLRALALICALAVVVAQAAVPGAEAQTAVPKPRVAVLDFTGVGVAAAETAAVTDQLRSDLVRLRALTVLDRAETKRILDELALQQTGITDPTEAVRIGKLLNVELVVTGRVTALANAYQINAQMIRVETGEIERSESIVHQGHLLGLLSDNLATVAARLADVEPEVARERLRQPEAVAKDDGGMPWWAWALIGLAVVGLAAAGGGGDDAAPGGGGSAGGSCSSPSGCGTLVGQW